MFKNYVPWAMGLAVALGLVAVVPAFAAGPHGMMGGWGEGGTHDGSMMGGPRMAPGVFGKVDSVSGTTFTVTQMQRPNSTTTPTVYTVDATNAKVMKNGTSSTVSAIAVGDTVMVQGTVTGASVTATVIRDGTLGMMGGHGFGKGLDRGTSTPPAPPIQGNGEPVVGGKVTAINGNTLTVANASNVTYTIDVTSAKIVKDGTTTTASSVATGDGVVVQGTVNGTAVTAASVIDQGAASPATGNPSSESHPGFFGAIGNFFKHIFGF